MGNPDDIHALVFDVFGTLVDWRSGVAREVAPFLARHAPHLEPFAFADAWRREYAPSMQTVRSGQRGFVRLDVLHRENLVRVLAAEGVARVDDATLDALTLAWHRLDPWPDTVAGLTRLKRRHIIAPLSNGNIRLMIDLARHGGLPWDAILGAEVVRDYKPSPRVYRETAEILGLAPHQLCLVAAHNGDLAAARALGLRTAFIARPTEHGPAQQGDLRAEADWDFIADDLGALATQLGCEV
ncbi:MAG: (S)-2-haloacid dehalogenase 4A [Burkholderia plantarii]|nr:MAG: (S)-2-haloacid dehalogenase 4A [Burkholderia plantarii]